MNKKKYNRFFVADFETTVFDGQDRTDVWSATIAEMFVNEEPYVFTNINDFFEFIFSLDESSVIYFHNLKFDGTFILQYLFNNDFKQKILKEGEKYTFSLDKELTNGSFKYMITAMGQWYKILIKYKNKYYEFRDSFKLLPFTLEQIGESFCTKYKKLKMDYKNHRAPDEKISDEEMKYIKADVLVLREALEYVFNEGHDSLTIGSCCMEEFKNKCNNQPFINNIGEKDLFGTGTSDKVKINKNGGFPDVLSMINLYDEEINEEIYGSKSAGEYCRKSYRGGWCYLVDGKQSKIFEKGTTYDVNSLYPSVMHSESGNFYPYGKPDFLELHSKKEFDDPVKKYLEENHFYYIIRLRTKFYIKPGKLPFITAKHNSMYPPRQCLTTSNIFDKKSGKWFDKYRDSNGEIQDAKLELTLTWNEYNLFLEHYFLYETEYLDLCYFKSGIGFFDNYINYYRDIKMNSKGAKRNLAKLFLNNLYGKLASSMDSSFKIARLEDGVLKFKTVIENKKRPGYIPMGTAVTAYAREFTIRAAQANYHGVNNPGFIYADTDSIHCDLLSEGIKDIKIHDSNFCCWKLETEWDKAIFLRAKAYIEITGNDVDIKCAGMPQKCKELFIDSLLSRKRNIEYSKDEFEFISTRRNLTDFAIGLKVPGKLVPKQIEGGVLLVETEFTMREGYRW